MAHTVAAVSSKKGQKLKLTDFLLRWGGSRRTRQTADEQLAVFQALAARQEKNSGR